MKKITRWSPDTCDCQLEYEWDTDLNGDNRQHNFVKAINVCPAHSHLKGQEHFNTIIEENVAKNKVINSILKLNNDLSITDIKFSYDDNRKLKIEINKDNIDIIKLEESVQSDTKENFTVI